MTMALNYTLISARSTFRNSRFVIFTMALPLVMYLLFNGLYGQQPQGSSGISVSAYLMVSMAAYGGLGAAINAGARIAIERQTGWNRQLRLSALTSRAYMISKSAVSLLVALPAIILVFLAGALVGKVRLPLATWVEAGLGVWLALIPFAVAGLVIGFLASVDSVQPLTMLVYMAMSILGGLWFPVDQLSSFLRGVAKVLPSYWVGQTGRSVLAGAAVPLNGVLVLAAWTVGLGLLGAMAYRRSGRKD
ncbi:ABC-2 type transport system permease protein [Nakamurella sp. UYEF19]|uniref:ABC transporter permease n=1 Tax=Nakamurella sp. UYEF19 TaxID=1756392 RepID=UPI00339ABBAA